MQTGHYQNAGWLERGILIQLLALFCGKKLGPTYSLVVWQSLLSTEIFLQVTLASFYLFIIINNRQPFEDLVPQATAPWFLAELSFQSDLMLSLLHLHWPASPTNHKEIPILLTKYTLISNFRIWYCSCWSYYSWTR